MNKVRLLQFTNEDNEIVEYFENDDELINIDQAPFIDAQQMYAADIINDGRVTAADLVDLRKLILGIDTKFKNNTSWRFYDAKQSENLEFPQGLSEQISVMNPTQEMYVNNFIGVKVGDVNTSASTKAQSQTVDTRAEQVWWEIENEIFVSGKSLIVPVKSKIDAQITGLQTSIKVNAGLGDFDVIISKDLNFMVDQYHFDAETSVLNISWHTNNHVDLNKGDIIFELVFKTIGNGQTKEMLSTNPGGFTSEFYDKNLEQSKFGIKIIDGENQDFVIHQNFPNPFINYTNIRFETPKSGEVTIKLFDAQGRALHKHNGIYSEGYHEYRIDETMINNVGVIFYEIQHNNKIITNKMIRLQR